MLFVGADGLHYPLIFAVTLVTRHAQKEVKGPCIMWCDGWFVLRGTAIFSALCLDIGWIVAKKLYICIVPNQVRHMTYENICSIAFRITISEKHLSERTIHVESVRYRRRL